MKPPTEDKKKRKPSGAARTSHLHKKVKAGLKAAFPDRKAGY